MQQLTINQPHSQPLADPWGGPSPSTQPNMSIQPPANKSQSLSDPWGAPAPTQKPADPWGAPESSSLPQLDPWAMPSQSNVPVIQDPFAPQNPPANLSYNGADSGITLQSSGTYPNLFSNSSVASVKPVATEVSKSSFLLNGSHLVDVENILAKPADKTTGANPFMMSSMAPSTTNPFMQEKPKPKSINEIRNDKFGFSSSTNAGGGDVLLPTPMVPANNEQQQSHNPFL